MKIVEFLIVGQGLAGTMLAFEMLKAGVDFRIVNAPNKSKASLVAAGMVNPLVFKRMTKSWLADDLMPVLKIKYVELEELLKGTFYFEKQILKPLSEQEKELWIERKQQCEFVNYVGDICDEAPIKNLKDSYTYAKVNGSGYLNLFTFLNAAEVFFRKKNLLIEKEFHLDSTTAKRANFGFDNYSSEKLVFCEGAHLSQNSLFDFVKLNPVKGEVLQIYAPKLSEDYILNKQVFVLPVGKHRFKVGSTYEWKDLSERTTEAGKLSIVERLNELVSVDYTIENQWAGIRPTVIDYRPVLGQHPECENIYIFNGLGTKGVMLAPFFAKEMIRFVNETNYVLPAEVNVKRFVK